MIKSILKQAQIVIWPATILTILTGVAFKASASAEEVNDPAATSNLRCEFETRDLKAGCSFVEIPLPTLSVSQPLKGAESEGSSSVLTPEEQESLSLKVAIETQSSALIYNPCELELVAEDPESGLVVPAHKLGNGLSRIHIEHKNNALVRAASPSKLGSRTFFTRCEVRLQKPIQSRPAADFLSQLMLRVEGAERAIWAFAAAKEAVIAHVASQRSLGRSSLEASSTIDDFFEQVEVLDSSRATKKLRVLAKYLERDGSSAKATEATLADQLKQIKLLLKQSAKELRALHVLYSTLGMKIDEKLVELVDQILSESKFDIDDNLTEEQMN